MRMSHRRDETCPVGWILIRVLELVMWVMGVGLEMQWIAHLLIV